MNLSPTFIKDRQSDKQLACVIEEPNIPPGAANLAPQITEFAIRTYRIPSQPY